MSSIPRRKTDLSDADLQFLLNLLIQNIGLFVVPYFDRTLFHGEYRFRLLDLISFKNEARNRNAHGVILAYS
ncbi:12784_t:CDS:1, partial [Acaulospora morrowiae]